MSEGTFPLWLGKRRWGRRRMFVQLNWLSRIVEKEFLEWFIWTTLPKMCCQGGESLPVDVFTLLTRTSSLSSHHFLFQMQFQVCWKSGKSGTSLSSIVFSHRDKEKGRQRGRKGRRNNSCKSEVTRECESRESKLVREEWMIVMGSLLSHLWQDNRQTVNSPWHEEISEQRWHGHFVKDVRLTHLDCKLTRDHFATKWWRDTKSGGLDRRGHRDRQTEFAWWRQKKCTEMQEAQSSWRIVKLSLSSTHAG